MQSWEAQQLKCSLEVTQTFSLHWPLRKHCSCESVHTCSASWTLNAVSQEYFFCCVVCTSCCSPGCRCVIRSGRANKMISPLTPCWPAFLACQSHNLIVPFSKLSIPSPWPLSVHQFVKQAVNYIMFGGLWMGSLPCSKIPCSYARKKAFLSLRSLLTTCQTMIC